MTAGQVLGATRWNQAVVANTEFLAKPPSALVRKSTDQALAAGSTWKAVSWNTEVFDNDTMWSSTDPTKVNINTNGKYQVSGHVGFGGAAVTAGGVGCYLGVLVDGTTKGTPQHAQDIRVSLAGVTLHEAGTVTLSLTSTQFVRLMVRSDSTSLVLHSTVENPFFAVHWISS